MTICSKNTHLKDCSQSLWDKAISNEFMCRARQWRDVADFEQSVMGPKLFKLFEMSWKKC